MSLRVLRISTIRVHVVDVKMTGKIEKLRPMWKFFEKTSILKIQPFRWTKCIWVATRERQKLTMKRSNPKRFFFFDEPATQRWRMRNKSKMTNASQSITGGGSYDMKGRAEKWVERYWKPSCKNASVSLLEETLCMDDHQLNPEHWTARENWHQCVHTLHWHVCSWPQVEKWQTGLAVDSQYGGTKRVTTHCHGW